MVTEQIGWELSGGTWRAQSLSIKRGKGCIPTGSGRAGQGRLDRTIPFGPEQKLSILSLGVLRNARAGSI